MKARLFTALSASPARRLLPPFGGLDLSPLLALLVLGVVLRLLIAPVRDLGLELAFGG